MQGCPSITALLNVPTADPPPPIPSLHTFHRCP